jgi:hypothetical protein
MIQGRVLARRDLLDRASQRAATSGLTPAARRIGERPGVSRPVNLSRTWLTTERLDALPPTG